MERNETILMRTLIFATNNQHKLEEVQAIIGSDFLLKSLNDIGCSDDIPETGDTFEENASQKSHFIYERYTLDCFADDSGLEIECLNNEPGVYSARYSGSRDTEGNMHLVLEKLKNQTNRKARFRTVISLILNGKEHLFEGFVHGTITTQQSGNKGFGYDPIFQPDGYNITFADMSADEKNKISHRGRAMQNLLKFLHDQQLK
ncbi:MAG: non-canonical purine pyrophosphatase, rdgB/HAM1 family [Sphingobacteriales bacterium]|nr:non-canonical purine pyrophosphatase, rdgB/HAM1 family [Sphingobacteriales bacterium]